MKTVYLLKNSPKSFGVLLKLVKMGDITTNIIIVDKFYSKILKKDKRVKEFPFIINTLPTLKGLIPKIAKVLPFNMFIYNFNLFNKQKKNNYFTGERIITYKPPLNRSPKLKNQKLSNQKLKNQKLSNQKIKSTYKKPIIRTIKQKDESVNIILYNK
jgi:hypothetical protein